jgi:hypothetical protein
MKPVPTRPNSNRPISRLVYEKPSKASGVKPTSSTPSASTPAPESEREKHWICETCTLENPLTYLCCDACTTERPDNFQVLERRRPAASLPSTPKTWTCHRCTTIMDSQWWTCSSCGTMKLAS